MQRPERTPTSRRTLLILALLLGALELVGLSKVIREAWMLATYRPVTAVVLSTDVEARQPLGFGRTFRPSIRYRFTVGDATYESDRVTPLGEGRRGQWAYQVVGRFAVGESVTIYHDTGDPSSAFLLRERSWFPWLFVVLPPVMFWAVVVMERRQRVAIGSRLAKTA